ncbi:MAG: helix-hairpin-helix domain-containing protein, partial [Aureliella sp.]
MEIDPGQFDYMQVAITTGVGPCLLQRLLEHFGNATEILSASPQQLSEIEGVGVGLARRLRSSEFRDQALRFGTQFLSNWIKSIDLSKRPFTLFGTESSDNTAFSANTQTLP